MIKLSKRIPQSLWNCIPSYKVPKVVALCVKYTTEYDAPNFWRLGYLNTSDKFPILLAWHDFFLWDLRKGKLYMDMPLPLMISKETFARRLQPFLQPCRDVYLSIWGISPVVHGHWGAMTFSTIHKEMQFHNDWGMYLKHFTTTGT